MIRFSIEIDSDTRPESLIHEASSIGHFLNDALLPRDDELKVSPDGKWGIEPVIKLQLALLSKADEMLQAMEQKETKPLKTVVA